MGIKGLKKFLRQKYPQCIIQSQIGRYYNQKITVDIASYIYKYKVIYGKKWMNSVLKLVCSFKKYKIHANIIFDGKPPKEKFREKKKREEQKQNNINNIKQLESDLEAFLETEVPSDLLLELMEKINKKTPFKVQRFLHSKDKETKVNVDLVQEYIDKKKSQIVNITPEEIQELKNTLTVLGVPWIQAPSEAESLAAFLSVKGDSKCIISEDTDVLAYGTQDFVSGYNVVNGSCEIIELKSVLEELEFSFDQFLDFCVMCGTDYNDNIPKIGIMTSFSLISEHKSIEEFEKKSEKDISILNHNVSRTLFKSFGRLKGKKKYKVYYWDTNINHEKVEDQLNKIDCDFSLDDICKYWQTKQIILE